MLSPSISANHTTTHARNCVGGGGIGGCVGGVAYVVYGKPALNALVGTIVGIAAGLTLGAVGALIAARRT
jgi:hypothetical protein